MAEASCHTNTKRTISLEWWLAREVHHLARAKAAFRQYVEGWYADPDAAVAERAAQIEALPTACFKGRRLRTVTCPRCSRARNYWESMLWSVIDIRHVICPWCLVRG